MSPVVIDIKISYVEQDSYSVTGETTRIIAFSKEERSELLGELGAKCKTYKIIRETKHNLRGLTPHALVWAEKLLINRLVHCVLDLETDPSGASRQLMNRIKLYREVGRYIFNLTDERLRKNL